MPDAPRRWRVGPSLGLVAASLVLLALYLAARFVMPPTRTWEMVGSGLLLVAAATGIAGVVGTAFQLAATRSFEWLIAWRYLRVQHRRSWFALGVGGALLVLGAGILVASYLWGEPKLDGLIAGPTQLQRLLQGRFSY